MILFYRQYNHMRTFGYIHSELPQLTKCDLGPLRQARLK